MTTKNVNGFWAYPPKEPGDQGSVFYYDGMEGGNKRTKDFLESLKKDGYKIEITSKEKTK
tara:strand:+ start:2122 stop:2301 length:180 start_codon:yes stop_codon:yes gene_type:complete